MSLKKKIDISPQVVVPALETKPSRKIHPTPKIVQPQPLSVDDLREEIAMLRTTLRRFFALANGCDDLETVANILGVIGLASTRLGRLLLTQRELGADHDPLMEAIQEAVAETAREMSTFVKDL